MLFVQHNTLRNVKLVLQMFLSCFYYRIPVYRNSHSVHLMFKDSEKTLKQSQNVTTLSTDHLSINL